MSLHQFLSDLFESGRVRLPAEAMELGEAVHQVDDVLVSFELRYRDMLPGTPPALCLPAARYGATMLYQACRFLVHRDLGVEALELAFREPLREKLGPSVHYSVDLSLRFLPGCRTV